MLWVRVEFFENFFCFLVRAITILEHFFNPSLLSHLVIVTFHYALKIINMLSRSLLLCFMLLHIRNKLLSMSLINLLDSLYLSLEIFFCVHIRPYVDIRGILEPNSSMVVFGKFTFHPQDFYLMELAHIVAVFVNLLEAIFFKVVSN